MLRHGDEPGRTQSIDLWTRRLPLAIKGEHGFLRLRWGIALFAASDINIFKLLEISYAIHSEAATISPETPETWDR
jgi:hypothetical protein